MRTCVAYGEPQTTIKAGHHTVQAMIVITSTEPGVEHFLAVGPIVAVLVGVHQEMR